MFPHRGPGPYELHHGGPGVLPWLFLLVLLAILVVAVIALMRQRRELASSAAPAALAAAPDPALAELRARYARGEIDRDEFLTRSADLGAPSTA